MTAPKPLRVLINAINDNEVPRGPDRYLLELIPHILAANPALEIDLAHAPWQQCFTSKTTGLNHPRLRYHCLAPPRRPALRLLWQTTFFPRFANTMQPDVTFLPNLIWTPRLRSPSVMTGHDFLQFRAPEKFGLFKSTLLRWVIKRAVRRCDRLLAVSEFTASDARRYIGISNDRIAVITEGGPPIRPRPDQSTTQSFLFVGKLEHTKGIDTLIAAFKSSALLQDAGYRLQIVGPDGNASDQIAHLLETGAQNIDRLGFISDGELEQLYLTCRGFVFPSFAEGFGLVLLEAMARGAPVIAAHATSLPEVVGKAGLLVPPNDVNALRRAMERLAQDDVLFERLQSAGYARLSDFSWANAGAQTADLLREVTQ